MQRIAVIGTGYVGLVTAACLSDLGNQVICVDSDRKKLENLKKGIIPIYEPGLEALITKNRKKKRISFTHSITDATKKSEIIFICVGTPAQADGGADLAAVEKVATEIAKAINGYKVIVSKSTVPTQTGDKIRQTIVSLAGKNAAFDVVSNPEFLREGQAISDTMHPDRIVIGVATKRAETIMRQLYSPIKAPILVTNIATAELIKHAANSFLSTKISYINALANICEKVGADVEKVAEGIGMDKRIGRQFLNAGPGFGGYCFPKDLDAFIHIAQKNGYDFELLKAVRKINEDQKKVVLKKIEDALWIIKDKTIAVLGLSFKPNSDDIRNSISIELIKSLKAGGAKIRAYDPKAMDKAKLVLKGVTFVKDPYQAAKGANCVLIMTDWLEFAKLDLAKIKKLLSQPIIVDTRNMFDPAKMKSLGFIYKCIGR
ncbi:MAG: UDP-glucose/GDP-mannose dehydrogenase family protein [Candidatus Omnitrophica bacterium]|nr:UDP-glucose/GDP-mannose dehydrogenase family protein [Candidatus Omnitrophota bacterium]